jgi:hypothetical protein
MIVKSDASTLYLYDKIKGLQLQLRGPSVKISCTKNVTEFSQNILDYKLASELTLALVSAVYGL